MRVGTLKLYPLIHCIASHDLASNKKSKKPTLT